jgi:hypothetical protein
MALSSYCIDRYILNGHDPVFCEDLATWTAWMENPYRLVQDTEFVDSARNRVRVCTAFLGVDVNFGDGEPVLFETVVFGGPYDWELYRYCTWEEAEQGHAAVIQRCNARGEVPPSVFKAQELAHRTLKKASQMAVTSLIERSFKGYQSVKYQKQLGAEVFAGAAFETVNLSDSRTCAHGLRICNGKHAVLTRERGAQEPHLQTHLHQSERAGRSVGVRVGPLPRDTLQGAVDYSSLYLVDTVVFPQSTEMR